MLILHRPITRPSSCLLTELSAEMRNHIYELAFTPDTDSAQQIAIEATSPPSKALLLTCKQINSEARGLYKSAYRSYWTDVHFTLDLEKYLEKDPEDFVRIDDLNAIRDVLVQQGPRGEQWQYYPRNCSQSDRWQELGPTCPHKFGMRHAEWRSPCGKVTPTEWVMRWPCEEDTSATQMPLTRQLRCFIKDNRPSVPRQ